MSLPGQSSSSPVAGQIVVVKDRFVEEDGHVWRGSTGCFSKSGLSRVRMVIARSSAKARRKLLGGRSRRRDDGTTREGGDGGGVDRFRRVSCVGRPMTLDSSVESVTSDPNDPEFSYEMLRDLLQRNEFFHAECNTNLDGAYYMCEHGK
ncbi:hypothetical protein MLD38_012087 [Melastoma candidum]|uniref:Uncharacterized protein n=1 Tax=Melastoma candidum TaxID=119954 RepID=A0ACB9R6H2_9MYRT|nr:hypothetical protein MLD38_012087 [Melastoma candidum]